jgi:hypothetical protein
VEQEVYPMESTPIAGKYVPETQYSEYSYMELTVTNGYENVNTDVDGEDEDTCIPDLYESGLDDTVVSDDNAAGYSQVAVNYNGTLEARRSGRQSIAPDRLGVLNSSI